MTSKCVDCGANGTKKRPLTTTADGPACPDCNTARNRARQERCDRERRARGKRHG